MSSRTLAFLVFSLLVWTASLVGADTYSTSHVHLPQGQFPVMGFLTASGASSEIAQPGPLLPAQTPLPAGYSSAVQGLAGRSFRVLAVLDTPSRRPALEHEGLAPAGQMGRVVSLVVDANDLGRLAQVPGVLAVRPPQIMQMHLDVNGVENGAVAARQATGATGAGTLVAVLDSGIDFTHRDFRNPDGTTRIKWIWDQFDNSWADSGGSIGSPPPVPAGGGEAPGTVYSEEQINAALQGTGVVNSVDLAGHGTFVASAAAGNGLATGNGQPAGVYVGTAPEADLLAVRVGGVSKTDLNITGDLIAALGWIDARADELGEPVVVNMSFGTQIGPHDGTTPEELAIGDFVQRPGRAVVASAGNDGASGIHASGSAKGSHTLQVFNAAQGRVMQIDCWLSGLDIVDLGFLDPTGGGRTDAGVKENLCAVIAGSVNTVTACVMGISEVNGDREVAFVVEATSTAAPISTGMWQFFLRDEGGVVDGRFDCWSGFGQQFSADLDASMLIAQPGTAPGAITVGAEAVRKSYESLDGPVTIASIMPGALAGFSSVGPTRDGRIKPDLTTGGNRVLAAWSIGDGTGSGLARVPSDPSLIATDGVHVASQGTSFAAPQVAGAVALLFERSPDIGVEEVRSLLADTARSDEFTGAVPNDDWGYGKLDVLAAFQATGDRPTRTPTPTGLSTRTPTPTRTSAASSGGGGGGCNVSTSSRGSPDLALLLLVFGLLAFRRFKHS